ncbi:MAG: hypothetical protein HDR35_08545 [Treponema sp.]|nr:hypothetical protein [Treponema sp.]
MNKKIFLAGATILTSSFLAKTRLFTCLLTQAKLSSSETDVSCELNF